MVIVFWLFSGVTFSSKVNTISFSLKLVDLRFVLIKEGSFFADGAGWANFTGKIEELASTYEYILSTDITDFYNQIYLHRLNNAIEHSAPQKKHIADDIEYLITTLNAKASQGVPVGPAASIVMAEAVLIDVDGFIRNEGFLHTRYVDDIRIFGSSDEQLNKMLEKLTLYLYETHRLTLSSEKTEILASKTFVSDTIHSKKAKEKKQIFEVLEIFNPYTGDMEEVGMEFEEALSESELLASSIEKVLSYDVLDLGLARSIIRSAKRAKNSTLIEPLLHDLAFFEPVVSDVALYLDELLKESNVAFDKPLAKAISAGVIKSQLARFWIEWLISKNAVLLNNGALKKYVDQGDISNRARAATTSKDLAWVRAQKKEAHALSSWGRRSVLMSCAILPSDERKHWLKNFANNWPFPVDRWVALWVANGGVAT